MPENTAPTFLTTKQAAKFLSLSPKTLEKMRVYGRGPVFIKMSSRVVYDQDDLISWAKAGARRSTSDPGPDHDKTA